MGFSGLSPLFALPQVQHFIFLLQGLLIFRPCFSIFPFWPGKSSFLDSTFIPFLLRNLLFPFLFSTGKISFFISFLILCLRSHSISIFKNCAVTAFSSDKYFSICTFCCFWDGEFPLTLPILESGVLLPWDILSSSPQRYLESSVLPPAPRCVPGVGVYSRGSRKDTQRHLRDDFRLFQLQGGFLSTDWTTFTE